MDEADVKRWVGDDVQAFRREGPDERSVLPNVAVGERVLGPGRTAIEQGAASQPRALVGRVAIQPGLALVEMVEKQITRAAHVGAGRRQSSHLDVQAMGRVPVVVVPMGDQLTPTQFAGQVAFRTHGKPLFETHVTDTLIVGDEVGDGILAVVHNDEFSRWIILPQKVPDGLADKAPSVAGWHYAANE